MSEDAFKYILSRAESIQHYSDELRSNLIEVAFWLFHFNPGIEVIDDKVLYERAGYQYLWAFDNGGLFFVIKTHDKPTLRDSDNRIKHGERLPVEHAARALLVEGVKRLPEFLQIIAERLLLKDQEFKEAAEAASKIQSVIEALKE